MEGNLDVKLRKVEKLCKQNKHISLYNRIIAPPDDDTPPDIEQWVGNGYCLYPITGLPTMDEENLLSIFDVAKPDDFSVRLLDADGFDFSDTPKGEVPLDPASFTLYVEGRDLWPMQCDSLFLEDGLLFVDTALLVPVDDDDEMRAYLLRKTTDGRPYVAVKSGLILIGIVMPALGLKEKHTETLLTVAHLCAAAAERKQNRDAAAD